MRWRPSLSKAANQIDLSKWLRGGVERRPVVDPPDPHHVALPAHGVEIQAVGTEPRPPQSPIVSAHAGAERLARADVIARTPRLEFPFSKRLLVVDLGKPRRIVAALPDFGEPRVVIDLRRRRKACRRCRRSRPPDPAAGGGSRNSVALSLDRQQVRLRCAVEQHRCAVRAEHDLAEKTIVPQVDAAQDFQPLN